MSAFTIFDYYYLKAMLEYNHKLRWPRVLRRDPRRRRADIRSSRSRRPGLSFGVSGGRKSKNEHRPKVTQNQSTARRKGYLSLEIAGSSNSRSSCIIYHESVEQSECNQREKYSFTPLFLPFSSTYFAPTSSP